MENQRNSGSLSKKKKKKTNTHSKVLFYLSFIGKVKQKKQNGTLGCEM